MACNHTNINCGCKDSFLTTPPPCPTPENCPDPQPCSEVFDAQCIVYTGVDIECNQAVVVAQNATVASALNSIVSFFCGADLGLVIPNDIFCQETPQVNTLVVPEDTLVNEAIELVVDYFCERLSNVPEAVVVSGTGITVTDNTVGNVTTYTVTNSSPASSVALTSAGGTETLVNDGTGPALATKGLTAGNGITLTSSATAVTITAAVNKYSQLIVLPGSGTITIPHNLNTLDIIVAVSQDGTPPLSSLSPGTDYTYTITGLNSIDITAVAFSGGPVRVTVIG